MTLPSPLNKPLDLVRKKYKEKWGEELDLMAMSGYTGFYILANALAKAKSSKPDDIRDALANMSISPTTDIYGGKALLFPYIGSKVEFDETGENKYAGCMIMQIQSNKYRVIGRKTMPRQKADLFGLRLVGTRSHNIRFCSRIVSRIFKL